MDQITQQLEDMKFKVRDFMGNHSSPEASELDKMVDNAFVHARQGIDVNKLEYLVKDIRSFIERIKDNEQVFNASQSDDLYDRVKQLVVMIDQAERR